MTSLRTFRFVTFFAGSGFKTLGLQRSRSSAGSRFVPIGGFDIDPIACADYEILTGHRAHVVDLGAIQPCELAALVDGEPDMVVMSPPCTGYSGCLGEELSKTEKYEALNMLARRAVDLALESWSRKPALILLENVPRMLTRGKEILAQIIVLLRAAGYEVDLRPHDCGEWGGLAQSRHRLLLVARLRERVGSHLLMPPSLGLRPMSDVLWRLPVPLPGPSSAGRLHRLPRLSRLNWLRLAAVRAGRDWRDIPAAVRHQLEVEPQLPDDGKRHAGKYGPQDPARPAHAVIAEARTGKGWSDVADPRLAPRAARQNGGFGVGDSAAPSHSVVAEGSVRNTWSSVSDPRMGGDAKNRQTGFYGVCDPDGPAHTVIAHARAGNNGWASVTDPRVATQPRNGMMGVADPERHSGAVLGAADVHNSVAAVADPRSECKRYDNALGVSDPGLPYKSPIIGAMQVHNNPSTIADPRLEHAPRRGSFGVQDPEQPSRVIRGEHSIRQAPAAVADARGYEPTHTLVAGQALDVSREEWVGGDFELVGPPVEFASKGKPCWLIILAPDGTVHRPMTTLELAALQGAPVWHRPGDPTELAIGAEGGQWLDLHGSDSQVRKHVGNAVPIATATAIGNSMLEALDAGAEEVFRLSSGGIWVQHALEASE